MKNQHKIVRTEQSYAWHAANTWLEMLYGNTEVMNDAEFRKLFDALERYVNDKIALPLDKPVIDMYVVAEQQDD